jgi:hypothetical protein
MEDCHNYLACHISNGIGNVLAARLIHCEFPPPAQDVLRYHNRGAHRRIPLASTAYQGICQVAFGIAIPMTNDKSIMRMIGIFFA